MYRYPWMVSLSPFPGRVCGGTLIASRYVLTAAHCVMRIKIIWENGKTEWESGTYLPDKWTWKPGEVANPAEYKVVEAFCNEVFYTYFASMLFRFTLVIIIARRICRTNILLEAQLSVLLCPR